jgi:hypothetical protein
MPPTDASHQTTRSTNELTKLTTAVWADAVICASTSVNSLEQMVELLALWQQAVAR